MTAVNRTITTDLPAEPATGSVVLDKNRRAWQCQEDGPRRTDNDTVAYWAPVAASGQFPTSATWIDLCHLAPLTVVWEPGAQPESVDSDGSSGYWTARLGTGDIVTAAEARMLRSLVLQDAPSEVVAWCLKAYQSGRAGQ